MSNITTPQAIAAKDRSAPMKVTGKLAVALDAMVWSGLRRDDAAKAAGLQPKSLHAAFRKPHVKAHYLHLCEVLRTSGRARRISRLEEMVEQNDNKMAVVAAARALEGLGDQEGAAGTLPRTPGLVIVIAPAVPPAPAGAPMTIDITPVKQ